MAAEAWPLEREPHYNPDVEVVLRLSDEQVEAELGLVELGAKLKNDLDAEEADERRQTYCADRPTIFGATVRSIFTEVTQYKPKSHWDAWQFTEAILKGYQAVAGRQDEQWLAKFNRNAYGRDANYTRVPPAYNDIIDLHGRL